MTLAKAFHHLAANWSVIMVNGKIVILDDSEMDLEALDLLLRENGFQTKPTTDLELVKAYVRQNRGRIPLAIIDFNLGAVNGAMLIEELKAIDPSLQIATYSGESMRDVFGPTTQAGSSHFISKDMTPDEKLTIIAGLCEKSQADKRTVVEVIDESENASLLASVAMIGRCEKTVKIAHQIQKMAPSDATVLILGENGTGKELAARAIHNLSGRRGEFVVINCGTFNRDLLESELFGHERGAFSGAVKGKVGLAVIANNGTLFLDEIGDLPLQLQVKLLRFIQHGEVRPVGGNKTQIVNVRVVCATNVDLVKAVEENRFREDLYYRVKQLPILLPPLRERKEDIETLVLRFAKIWEQRSGKKKAFLESTMKALKSYDWPGNIRELENEVERLWTMVTDEKIRVTDLEDAITAARAEEAPEIDTTLDYDEFRASQIAQEREYLRLKGRGMKSVRFFADLLNVSNSTLQRRLKELGIIFQKSTEPKGDRT